MALYGVLLNHGYFETRAQHLSLSDSRAGVLPLSAAGKNVAMWESKNQWKFPAYREFKHTAQHDLLVPFARVEKGKTSTTLAGRTLNTGVLKALRRTTRRIVAQRPGLAHPDLGKPGVRSADPNAKALCTAAMNPDMLRAILSAESQAEVGLEAEAIRTVFKQQHGKCYLTDAEIHAILRAIAHPSDTASSSESPRVEGSGDSTSSAGTGEDTDADGGADTGEDTDTDTDD